MRRLVLTVREATDVGVKMTETTERVGSLSVTRDRSSFRVPGDSKGNMHVCITDPCPWQFFGDIVMVCAR